MSAGRFAVTALLAASALVGARSADAAALRYQIDQRGDFVLLGNTLGQDCGPGVPAPVVGTVGACGNNTSDTAIDVFWRAADSASASADTSITNPNARSTAMLALPPGAVITYARLYWSASYAGAVDTNATLDRPGTGGFSSTITADASATATSSTSITYYQSTADITALVQAKGAGAYRVSDVAATDLLNVNNDTLYSGWSMVVFYRLDTDPQRNLTLFDGLDLINSTGPSVTVNLSGFLVPIAGFDAKLGVVTYEGDDQFTGDSLSFNGTALSDALNPANNFFNGTRSRLGVAVSNAGDLPQTTGRARSLSGMDLDVVDVTARVAQGQTSATITASTSQDFYLLGVFVTSISTYKPDFSGAIKTVTDLNTHPNGAVLPGDLLEYTISASNTGNDPAINVVLNDALPAGLTFAPGSIRIVSGAGAGTKTNATGDDQGEYLSGARTVRVRLGTGANGSAGGSMAIGASTSVAFRATVNAGASGLIQNQAIITASGQSGAPSADYVSDGNGGAQGAPPTPVVIDGCSSNADCGGATPLCLTTASPRVCVGCLSPADCSGPKPTCDAASHVCRACSGDGQCSGSTPACMTTGACGHCSGSNSSACTGAKPACDVPNGVCVECVTSATCAAPAPVCNSSTKTCVGCLATADCSGSTPVCDPAFRTCRACSGDAECGGSTPACQPTGACGVCSATNSAMCGASAPVCNVATGTCVRCVANADCSGATPLCDLGSHTCRGCTGDGECGGATPACQPNGACGICSATNATKCNGATPVCSPPTGTCVACVTNAQCSGSTPVCNTAAFTCRGCSSDGDCGGSTPACQPSGACGVCSATNANRCSGTTPVCNPPTGSCVACLTNAQCSGSTPVCNTTTHTCGACSGDGDCGGATPACRPSGVCGVCSATNASKCSGSTPVCDVAGGTCVTCLTGAQCSGSAPVCDGTTHTCRGCTGDGDCGGATPACQPTGICGICSATNSAMCGGSTPACNAATGTCVPCATNAQCTGATPVCNGATHTCRGCTGDGDCGGSTPACQPSGACGVCSATNTSRCTGTVPACDTSTGTCRGCTGDGQCSGTAPVCDTSTKSCRGCNSGAECGGSTPFCTPSGACGACSATDITHCPATKPLCDTSSGGGVCVGCLNASDCGGTLPLCAGATHTCAPCTSDGAPSCPDAARPACQMSGPLAGACTECSPTNTKLCVGLKPQCLPATGLCGCSGPQADGACGDMVSGLICSGPNGICTPGCGPAPRNDCPSGQMCMSIMNGAGQCGESSGSTGSGGTSGGTGGSAGSGSGGATSTGTAGTNGSGSGGATSTGTGGSAGLGSGGATSTGTAGMNGSGSGGAAGSGSAGSQGSGGSTGGSGPAIGCDTDADCHNPLPRCDYVASTGRCVQCLVSADCGGSLICDPKSKTCTECAPTSAGACRPDLAGAQCLTGGQCGCTVDADCGGPTSGRVCDAAINICKPGCRGTGGNTCPVSLVCSSTTAAIGHCSDPSTVSPDGGTGGTGGTAGDGGGPRDGGGSDARADAADSGGGAGGHGGADGGVGSMNNLELGHHITGGGCRCDLDGTPGSSSWTLLSLAGFLAVLARRSRRGRPALRKES